MRETAIWVPLSHPQLGTWPATQACALTGDWAGGTQSTEPHQPGPALNSFAHVLRSETAGLQMVPSWSFWVSWICISITILGFGEVLGHYFFQLGSLLPLSLPPPSIMYMLFSSHKFLSSLHFSSLIFLFLCLSHLKVLYLSSLNLFLPSQGWYWVLVKFLVQLLLFSFSELLFGSSL